MRDGEGQGGAGRGRDGRLVVYTSGSTLVRFYFLGQIFFHRAYFILAISSYIILW